MAFGNDVNRQSSKRKRHYLDTDFSIMDSWIMLGLVAGLFTTVGFVPQIIKAYRTKRMEDVSLIMPILLSLGMLMWLFYGIVLNNLPIILWNAIALGLNLTIFLLKFRYGGTREEPARMP